MKFARFKAARHVEEPIVSSDLDSKLDSVWINRNGTKRTER